MSHDRTRARCDRVIEQVDLGALLQEYGYAVVPDRMREQQFSCDLHGPDHKPSARYYGQSNTTYCWVCQKKRDAVSYVMEKESLSFRDAILFLERKVGLEPLPWDEDPPRPPSPEEVLEEMRVRRTSFAEEHVRLSRFLEGLTRDRDCSCDALLAFWEVLDRVEHGVRKENWEEAKGIAALSKLRERIFAKLKPGES